MAKLMQGIVAGQSLDQITLKGGDPRILAEAVNILGPYPVRLPIRYDGILFLFGFPIVPANRRRVTKEDVRGACHILAQKYLWDIQAEAPQIRMKDFKDRVQSAIEAIRSLLKALKSFSALEYQLIERPTEVSEAGHPIPDHLWKAFEAGEFSFVERDDRDRFLPPLFQRKLAAYAHFLDASRTLAIDQYGTGSVPGRDAGGRTNLVRQVRAPALWKLTDAAWEIFCAFPRLKASATRDGPMSRFISLIHEYATGNVEGGFERTIRDFVKLKREQDALLKNQQRLRRYHSKSGDLSGLDRDVHLSDITAIPGLSQKTIAAFKRNEARLVILKDALARGAPSRAKPKSSGKGIDGSDAQTVAIRPERTAKKPTKPSFRAKPKRR